MTIQKACVILGAGASYDVGGKGSPLDASFRPPLAIDLFNIEKHGAYWNILRRYSGAKFLGQRLARKSASGIIDIERELREYAKHPNKEIREAFKHIPAYLRDLLFSVSTVYTAVPSSYVELVQTLLADYEHDVLFLTLNYDNLLEQALTLFNSSKFQFSDINQYADKSRNVKVVKIHGSINWFRRLPGGQGVDWYSIVADLDIFEQLTEGDILIADAVNTVRDKVLENHKLYPILTAPLAGKGLIDVVCPDSHITAAKQFMTDCNKFLIIGTSGLDEDLLELLDTTIDPMQGHLVDIVGKHKGATDAQSRFEKGVRAFHKMHGTTMMTIYKEGFQNYLESQEFQKFSTFRM